MKTMKIFKVLFSLAVLFSIGSMGGGTPAGLLMVGLATSLYFLPKPSGVPGGLVKMASEIDIDDVITEWGAYYRKDGQNFKNLINRIYDKAETAMECRSLLTENTQVRYSAPAISSLVQPFQTAFTSKGNVDFPPKTFDLFQMKIDWEEYLNQFHASWLGFLADENKTYTEWPFVKYLIEKLIVNKAKEDVEQNEIFYGEFAAPTPGTPGPSGTSMDGFKTLLDAGIASGDINEISLSDFTASNTLDNIEEFAGTVDEALKGERFKIFCSKTMRRNYHRDARNTFGPNPTYEKGSNELDFENGRLAPVASMAGTNALFATPDWNVVHIRRRKQHIPFRVEVAKRQLAVYTEWFECVGFLVDDYVHYYAPADSGSGSGSGS